MALVLTIDGVDKTAVLQHGSLSIKTTADGAQGIADFTLINFTPDDDDTVVIADGATTYFDGHVRSRAIDEYKVGHYFVGISCQDDAVAFDSVGAAPFALSDTPDNVTSYAYLRLRTKVASPRQAGTAGVTETNGTVSTKRAGLAPGQLLTLTSANNGLAATVFNIVELTITFGDDGTPIYTAAFGDSPVRLVDILQTQINTAITVASETLAVSLRAPKVVLALPELPDPEYPEGTLAYLTTDGKVYRVIAGDLWSKAVDGGDLLVGSITAGAIQAGAIGAQALAAEIVLASLVKTSSGPDRVEIDADGVRSYLNDALTAELSPEGISAESIRVGVLAGGHNQIRNSSFEVAAFVNAETAVTFTDGSGTPGWKAANRTTALDNVTEGTSLSATTVAYA